MLFVTALVPGTQPVPPEKVEKPRTPLAQDGNGSASPPAASIAPSAAPAKAAKKPPRTAKRERSLGAIFVKFLLPVMAVGLLIFAVKHVLDSRRVDTPVAPPVKPASAPFSNTVAGNGMIEARMENIEIGSPMPGLVVEVYVKEGDKVKNKQQLFKLDDRQLQSELKVREANVFAAKAELERLENEPRPEEIPVREAMLAEAEANHTQRRDDLRRTQDLYAKRVSTEQELRQAEQAAQVAAAQVSRWKAELKLLKAGAWQYQKDIAQAAIEQAESQVTLVKTELDRLIVRALADGEVLQVNVRPGEFVGAPHNEALLLLGDVHKLHVRVDIDEHDIPRFVGGRPAKAAIKGHPDLSFPLTFVRVEPYVVPKQSLTGMNTERVDTRVLQVIYSFDPAGKPVYVGQQVEVFIDAGESATGGEKPAAAPVASSTGSLGTT